MIYANANIGAPYCFFIHLRQGRENALTVFIAHVIEKFAKQRLPIKTSFALSPGKNFAE